jgi:hypothetical protein
MHLIKKVLVVIPSLIAIGAVVYGVREATRSKLFIVQSIEVESTFAHPPLDNQKIIQLASVPLGKVSLFQLDLKSIERRILANDWVREVQLKKRLLHTLMITVHFREPRAIVQTAKGTLSYVDEEGRVFGSVSLVNIPDLPILSKFSTQQPEKIKEAIKLIRRWEDSPLAQFSTISSLTWEPDRGYRVLASYLLGAAKDLDVHNSSSYARTMIDLGSEVDANLDGKLLRLIDVFKYLSGNSIAVRQIWADAGKKIVVKTVRGS